MNVEDTTLAISIALAPTIQKINSIKYSIIENAFKSKHNNRKRKKMRKSKIK